MSRYCISDLHGRYDLWQQVKDFVKPDDTIYFLGDAADRGPDGWKLIKELLTDKRIIYIKGNHEELLINAVDRMMEADWNEGNISFGYDAFSLWVDYNGGWSTYKEMIKDPGYIDVVDKLRNLPTLQMYQCDYENYTKTIYLCHAGFTPNIYHWDLYLNNCLCDEKDLLWDRTHFANMFNPNLQIDKTAYVIHGHTPITNLYKQLKKQAKVCHCNEILPSFHYGAYWYTSNKCDIDNGSFATGKTCLLNLDTFDEYIFEGEPDEDYYV